MEIAPIPDNDTEANSNHVITNRQMYFKMLVNTCHMHNERIEYICETCDEMCCERCFVSGQHSNPVGPLHV